MPPLNLNEKTGCYEEGWLWSGLWLPWELCSWLHQGQAFTRNLCQVWQGFLAWHWSWGKKSVSFSTQIPKCQMYEENGKHHLNKKKEKKPNLSGVQARGCSHWGSGASILYQHEHFTSAICQVSFTAVSGQLFLHWWAPSERNWSAPGEI